MKRDGLLLVSNPNLFLSPLPRAKGSFLPISCARHVSIAHKLCQARIYKLIRISCARHVSINLSVGIPVHMLFLAVDMAVFIDKIDSH